MFGGLPSHCKFNKETAGQPRWPKKEKLSTVLVGWQNSKGRKTTLHKPLCEERGRVSWYQVITVYLECRITVLFSVHMIDVT